MSNVQKRKKAQCSDQNGFHGEVGVETCIGFLKFFITKYNTET